MWEFVNDVVHSVVILAMRNIGPWLPIYWEIFVGPFASRNMVQRFPKHLCDNENENENEKEMDKEKEDEGERCIERK